MAVMTAADLRAFAGRDWAAAAAAKRDYWAQRFQREGPAPARLASSLLLDHSRRLGIAPLDEARRDADLAQRLTLRERLDRAARALADR